MYIYVLWIRILQYINVYLCIMDQNSTAYKCILCIMDQNSTVYQRIVCIMDQNSTVYERIFMYYGIRILQYMNVYLCIMGSEFYSI